MKMSELRQETTSGLKKRLEQLKSEQFKLTMSQGSGQLSKTHLLQEIKKRIARVWTVLNEKREQL